MKSMDTRSELVRKSHEEVWSKGNLAVADEIYSRKIVRHSADQTDEIGRDAYKRFIVGTREAFPDWTETVESIIASRDLVATKVVIKATMTGSLNGPAGQLPPTGNDFELSAAVFYRITDGMIAEIWSYYDSVPILKTIGVMP